MNVFVLTCVNEVKEVISVKAFDSLEKAQKQMQEEYDSELKDFLLTYDEDEMQEFSISQRSARVVYEFNTDAYWWDINECCVK